MWRVQGGLEEREWKNRRLAGRLFQWSKEDLE